MHCRIIYCNDGFCDLTGFSRAEVMQKSCRVEFLYGQNTFPQAVQQLNAAIENQTDANIELLLYKKDGKGCSKVLRLHLLLIYFTTASCCILKSKKNLTLYCLAL